MTADEAATRLRAYVRSVDDNGRRDTGWPDEADVDEVLDDRDRLIAFVGELTAYPQQIVFPPDAEFLEEEIQAWREAFHASLGGPLVFRDERERCLSRAGSRVCTRTEGHEGHHRDRDDWAWLANTGTWPEGPDEEAPTHRTERA